QALIADPGCVGTDLLLTLVAAAKAPPFQLPLRKRKQLQLRLARSTRAQAIAAGALIALGAVADVDPANPISTYLLDRRLYVQRLWRVATGQPGPSGEAFPVVVLDQRSAETLGAASTPGRVSRELLAQILQRMPVAHVPKVVLDVVLDQPGPATDELAAVIRAQRRPLVFAGFFGGEVEAQSAGQSSMPLPVLRQAGLQARNLAVGTPSLPGGLKWVPLQLWEPLNASNFSGALSTARAPWMPVDAVIDWSIDWRPLLRRVELRELPSLQSPTLVVGTDGSLDRDGNDLFVAPGAMDPALTLIWQGAQAKLPGVLVQAVLAQSLSLHHWLTPASQAFSTALAAGLGVLVAAAQAPIRRRMVLVAAIIVVAAPICWQLAISQLWLLPLALPLAALITTACLRRD
ncbi:MAG: CHASE2 domain-containing protein, partial [Synechococcaceae bacterium WB9_2_170]|nr:CHASE2 domain-containing protein [Synechococcaceae bacterium WB9_2_170]